MELDGVGDEREPGYPVSDELPTYPGSKHRFTDFENGVLYWKAGASSAATLGPLTIGNASRSAEDVLATIGAEIVKPLKSHDEVYIRSGPTFGGVTDYQWDGTRVRNRLFVVKLGIGIDVPAVGDPTSDLTFRIEFSFDRANGTVWASLFDAQFHTHAPWPTAEFVKADQINAMFKKEIDPLVGKPQGLQTLPENIRLLSAKVMPTGDLNVYVQPLLDA